MTDDAGHYDDDMPEKPDFSALQRFIQSIQDHANQYPWKPDYCPPDNCNGFYQPEGARMALRCEHYETKTCPYNARNILAAWGEKAAQWGIPQRYRWPDAKKLFGSDPESEQKRAFLEKYIVLLSAGETNQGLLMSGGVGTGKSMAMAFIARRLWQHNRDARLIYIHAPDLMDSLHSDEPVVDIYSSTPLLLLDDVGTEYLADWNISKFSQIMERRHKNMRPTIITTNLAPAVLDRHEALARVIDRWKENCRLILLTGPSMRQQA